MSFLSELSLTKAIFTSLQKNGRFYASTITSCGGNNSEMAWALNPMVEQAINKQITTEFTAAYAYTVLGCYFERPNVLLPGFGKFLHKHSNEERKHGLSLCTLMKERGGVVKFSPLQPPKPQEWNSPLEALKAALELENETFKGVNELLQIAAEVGDNHTNHFVGRKLFDLKGAGKLQKLIKICDSAQSPQDIHNVDIMLQINDFV